MGCSELSSEEQRQGPGGHGDGGGLEDGLSEELLKKG